MRQIKLTGREVSVVKALGFTESKLGSEIQDYTQMQIEDVTDTLNGLMAAGFVDCIPFVEEVQLAEVLVTTFELNPAYAQEMKFAIYNSV
jgi:hypothetical protein